ncbi:MAG: hypothetical protein P1U69_03255 [Parvibaculaceae bacterium]|nr:hypothetical protein [Parvibaculaceae bacterium]
MSPTVPTHVGILGRDGRRVAIITFQDHMRLVGQTLHLGLTRAAEEGRAHEYLERYNVPFTIPEEDNLNDQRQTS